MMNLDTLARFEKVRRLMDSPIPGEAAAAHARYVAMLKKHAAITWVAEELAALAITDLEEKGYAVGSLEHGWYVCPVDDAGRVICCGDDAVGLMIAAESLRPHSEVQA